MRIVRTLSLTVTAAAAAIALAACAPGPTGSASPAPTPAPTRIDVSVGTVLASGAFPDDGEVHGSVEILRGDGSWIVRYHDLTLAAGVVSDEPYLLANGPTKADGCPTQTAWRVDLGVDAKRDGDDYVAPIGFVADPSFDDPTYIDGLGIRLPGIACSALRFAVAPLTWTFAPIHPDLTGTDSGSQDGATGIADGGIYTVASGDTAEGIEARFGLSADDLNYLNPISQRPSPNPWVQFPKPGCTLNVAFADRWRFIDCS